MLKIEVTMIPDFFAIDEGRGYTSVEGHHHEWREVARCLRTDRDAHFKRVAAMRQPDGSYRLWSPRNSMHENDYEIVGRADVAAFADSIDTFLDRHMPKPTVVCLCGSTRFMEAFQAENLRLTLEGKIVLSVGCNTKSDASMGLGEDVKKRLDELHLRKIDMADEVLVLNVGGYIGESTRREIAYAIRGGKVVNYLEKPTL